MTPVPVPFKRIMIRNNPLTDMTEVVLVDDEGIIVKIFTAAGQFSEKSRLTLQISGTVTMGKTDAERLELR